MLQKPSFRHAIILKSFLRKLLSILATLYRAAAAISSLHFHFSWMYEDPNESPFFPSPAFLPFFLPKRVKHVSFMFEPHDVPKLLLAKVDEKEQKELEQLLENTQ